MDEDTEGAEGSGSVPPPPSTTGASGPPPPSDGSTGDPDMGGNPLCCEAHPSSGCDSATTEMCVCTSEPSCCQAVWSVVCVDLAVQCGDPFCDAPVDPTDDPPPDGTTGDPPPDDSGDPPPPPPAPSCPCLAGVDNFCLYGPNYPDCPMTAPGGYCDPNGDGSFKDGDWDQGWFDYNAQC